MSKQEASNSDTSAQRLEELCADPLLRILVASDPAAPAHLLALLAYDQDVRVRENVAGNPKAPWKTLEQLAWEFPHTFLHHPAGPCQLLADPEQVSTNRTFWEAVLREDSVPPVWWNWLLSEPTLRLSPALHLHIQYAGETAHPYGACQPGEERTVLDLVELVTSAWTQRATLPGDRRGDQTLSCEQMVKEHLQWLAHSVDPKIRCAVAGNEQTPAEVFCALAQDTDERVQLNVAQSKQAPADALQTLAQDAKKQVRWAVAENKQAPKETLRRLSQDREQEVRRAVAGNPQAPVEALQTLAQDAETEVRCAVAANVQTPADALQILAQDGDAEVRLNLAWNPQTPADALRTLAQDAEKKVRLTVAENKQAPKEVLQILAQDGDAAVRQRVAANRQAPKEVLQTLAQDAEQGVRQVVAGNEQTPVEILHTLAREIEEEVQWYAGANPQMPVPAEVLQTLAQDAKQMRIRLAGNPQTPTEILHTLAQESEKMVRRAVAGNWQAPADALRTLAQDTEASVRRAVAGNPQTPAEALRILAQDAEASVQWLANLALRLDEETEPTLRSERWWKYLRSFTSYRGLAPEHHLDHIAHTKAPNAVLQIILEAFAVDWDESLHDVDERYGKRMWVRIIAPFVSPIMLRRFAPFASWKVRFLVALHEETPWETRRRLCQDGNRYVRAVARAKAAQRAEQGAN